MTLHTLFEHETLSFDWDDRFLAMLERLNRQMGGDILRIGADRGQRVIRATQFVGIVRVGDTLFQILPKIYRHTSVIDRTQQIHDATANLLHLLSYAERLEIRQSVVTAMLEQQSNWFELLTRLFATHLMAEWQRGPARAYETIDDELTMLKGSLRISDQIRHPARHHRFAVAYDELTADTPLNRIFRYVVERLWHLTRDLNNRRLLGDLRQWMDTVTLLPTIPVRAADPSLLTRLNQRFLPLLNLARLFLSGGTLQLAAGEQSNFAFVFDMNRLFEEFIAGFLHRHRSVILPPPLHDCIVHMQSDGMRRYLARYGDRGLFALKPDLVLENDDRVALIIDTKYKRLNWSSNALGIAQPDFYQMYAYAMCYNCSHVVLLYPQTSSDGDPLIRRFAIDGKPGWSIFAASIDMSENLTTTHGHQHLIKRLQVIIEETAV